MCPLLLQLVSSTPVILDAPEWCAPHRGTQCLSAYDRSTIACRVEEEGVERLTFVRDNKMLGILSQQAGERNHVPSLKIAAGIQLTHRMRFERRVQHGLQHFHMGKCPCIVVVHAFWKARRTLAQIEVPLSC